MKSKISTQRILVVALSIFIFASILFAVKPVMAYASDVDTIAQQYGPGGTNGESAWPSKLAGYFIADTAPSAEYDQSVTVNNKRYYYKSTDEASILNAGKSLNADNSLAQLDDLYDLSADTRGAAGLLSGLEAPLRTFLGILVTCITVGMTLITAFDLCYLAFPLFRGKMDDAKSNGTKGVTRTNSKGETKLNIVTEDAQYAVVAAETVQTGKNPFIIYGQKRVVSFVVLAVLIFILLTGNINILTNIGVKLASGILDAINNTF